MVLGEKVNRLGIFFFYDKDGIVDDYVTYLLDDLVKSLQEVVIICNGKLTSEGRHKFRKYTENVIVRENKGLDVWAYKTALDYVGWEVLQTYDEIVLLNNTIMGPVYPFSEMFENMSKKDLDFWGITKYGQEDFDPFGCNPYGYIPEHIQSHFIAFRQELISGREFKEYWNHMPEIKNYNQSIGLFETVVTKKFEDMGYEWDVYVDTDEYKDVTTFPLNHYPKELIRDKKCPIFKRRNFFQEYDYVLANTAGQPTVELYNYLRETGLYDVNMIWDNILRTCHQQDFVQALHLNYIVPSKHIAYSKTEEILKHKKLALIMHLYFPDLVEESKKYASYMPKQADIYITTNTKEKKLIIEKEFSDLECGHLEVRVIENRGRDVSSLLVGVKDVIEDYDLACFVHDKKTSQITPGSVGGGFAYKCYNNTLYNTEFVNNIILTFEENERLGILSPPMPNHADYFPLVGNEWGCNYQHTQNLAEKLNITVPMSERKMAIAPYGTFFWFRPKALKPLFAKSWKYEDFPSEPNDIDGTVLHAIERIYPFAVQQAGYYPAIVMSDEFAKIEYTNLLYYVRNYNRVLAGGGIQGHFHGVKKEISGALNEKNEIDSLKMQIAGMKQMLQTEHEEKERFVQLAADLYPKTSIKYQIKDRLKRLLHR